MLHDAITARALVWAADPACPARAILDHVREAGRLRAPQREAVTVWAYLKLAGGGRPIWELFAEGFFTPDVDLDALAVPVATRDVLQESKAAQALYHFAAEVVGGKERLPALADKIRAEPDAVDYEGVIRAVFYDEDYADYLFSLPMGAGKTFLIAALIHLDLYFAMQAPDDPAFAKNFLVLIPSGLKSSIGPSLRTIEHFDPTWVLPEPAASEVHRALRLDVLDEAKAGKRSNKARNPNSAKVAACQPFLDALGHVFIVNAEKVILNRVPTDAAQFELLEESDDERDRRENELRNLLGKLPRLAVHIDEVHHAQKDDVKLRQVVNKWAAGGNVASVYGYSGTPYLKKKEVIPAGGVELTFKQITNTVYHHPLATAIAGFLKTPTVEVLDGMEPPEIVRRGVAGFRERYAGTVYADGTCAKLAVYCGTIARLEEDVRPMLREMGVPDDEVLVYHKGNKQHPAPDTEAEFRMLDRPESRKRIVLLVQIGKEGWDCRSLSGVVLSQKGDSPANMVLQTACRCLRQVTPHDADATARIWLNTYNAKKLDAQLKAEQHTSIAELNKIAAGAEPDPVARVSRVAHLGLPEIPFFQLKVTHTDVVEDEADPGRALEALVAEVEASPSEWVRNGRVTERALTDGAARGVRVVEDAGLRPASFGVWLARVHRGGLGTPSWSDLRAHQDVLHRLFLAVTYERGGARFYNEMVRLAAVEARLRLAFHDRRSLRTEAETVPTTASLLAVDAHEVERHDLLYPSETDVDEILRRDTMGQEGDGLSPEQEAAADALDKIGQAEMAAQIRASGASVPVRMKERTFHYLPYSFRGSRLERDTLLDILTLADFADRDDLQVFFNGERRGRTSLSGFRIDCYRKAAGRWVAVGAYTPDFLLTKRDDDGAFERVLILETKGSGFAGERGFVERRAFVEGWFLTMNNGQPGLPEFRFVQLTDSEAQDDRLVRLRSEIQSFFATIPTA